MLQFKTIKQDVSAEIVEKKSKFIAHIFYVETIEEAESKIKEIKEKYKDARHNCFAYAIETGDGGIAVKYNDDGEPQGTAGSPILKLILGRELSNVLVIVTRYFGGILLGTGGLVRAYTGATGKALEKEGLTFLEADVKMIPNNYITLDENGVRRMELLLEKLDELDDVIDVYHNWDE